MLTEIDTIQFKYFLEKNINKTKIPVAMSRIKKHKISKEISKNKTKKFSKEVMWTIIFSAVLFISVVGMVFSSVTQNENYLYNKYKFQQTTSGWALKLNGEYVNFDFFPKDIEMINISQSAIALFKNSRMMYITFNPESRDIQTIDLFRFQMGEVLAKHFQTYIVSGIINSSNSYNLSIITCENATITVPVIQIESGDESSVEVEENCIKIKGTNYGLLAIKDRILYEMFGVMKPSTPK